MLLVLSISVHTHTRSTTNILNIVCTIYRGKTCSYSFQLCAHPVHVPIKSITMKDKQTTFKDR